LMTSTSDVLDESLTATEQQREAANQVSTAMVEIRTAAEQLAAEQEQRKVSAERVTQVIADLYSGLEEFSKIADETGHNGHAPSASGNGKPAQTVGSAPAA
jgi:methyl-accepting chemotaxis protein